MFLGNSTEAFDTFVPGWMQLMQGETTSEKVDDEIALPKDAAFCDVDFISNEKLMLKVVSAGRSQCKLCTSINACHFLMSECNC